MAEELQLSSGNKTERYQELLPQIEALISSESDVTANLANTAAALWQSFGFFWIGFYRVDSEELVLGPFQGPIACTRIPLGKGVCGTAWEKKQTLVVEDVDTFPGHIVCASASKSEIVVPIFNAAGEVSLVLDIDSDQLSTFDDIDAQYLEQLAKIISNNLLT